MSLDEFSNKNCGGTKPTEFLIKDKKYEVSTWTDVLVASIQYCIESGKDKDFIKQLDGVKEDKKGWVRVSNEGMRTPRELEGLGLFMETHGDSWTSIRRVKIVCEKLELPFSDVLINLKE